MIHNQATRTKISVIGLGRIGLPTAALLASHHQLVIGVDANPDIVKSVNQGQGHFNELGLDELVSAAIRQGYLRAVVHVEPADIFLVAVPTPINPDLKPNLSYLEHVLIDLALVLTRGNLILFESTAPVGTTSQLAEKLAKARPDLTFPQSHGDESDIRIAYCPERVLPGNMLRELVQNDRIIGGMTSRCSAQASAFYRIFVAGECFITTTRTAEMCKLVENSFRDVNIAFANELSMICDTAGVNVWELIRLANRHPRVDILRPGPGVGGHCIAIDPWFLIKSAPEEARLMTMAREVNNRKVVWVVEQVKWAIIAFLQENPTKIAQDVTIACFGLTYKPDTDDLRESPALHIVQQLVDTHQGPLLVVEPNIKSLPECLSKITVLTDAKSALAEATILLMLVDHASFKEVHYSEGNHYKQIDVCSDRAV